MTHGKANYYGDFRKARDEGSIIEMIKYYELLSKEEQFSALDGLNPLAKKVLLRSVSKITLEEVIDIIVGNFPENTEAVGIGRLNEEYCDGYYPIVNEWVKIKDITTLDEDGDFAYKHHINCYESSNTQYVEMWRDLPMILLEISKFVEDFVDEAEFIVIRRNGEIDAFGIYQEC